MRLKLDLVVRLCELGLKEGVQNIIVAAVLVSDVFYRLIALGEQEVMSRPGSRSGERTSKKAMLSLPVPCIKSGFELVA